MGRHRREYPQGRLRLKYPKDGFDKQKEYTLYFEYTWLDDAPIRKDTGLRVRVADWNDKGTTGKGELRASYGNLYYQLATHTTASHAGLYNDACYGNVYRNTLKEFLKPE
jgi:hypothetical protein